MRKSTVTLVTAALACLGAGQVSAAERLSDTAYLAAMRCQGLAEARQMDVSMLETTLKSQKRGRDAYIGDRAKRALQDAERDGRSENLTRKARVDAELAGMCHAYLGQGSALASTGVTGG